MDIPSSSSQTAQRHPEFYFNDGTVVLLVENHLFKVHRYFLERESSVFADMFSVPQGDKDKDKVIEGSDEQHPIVIPSCKSEEFASLLWFFYKSHTITTAGERASTQEWKSILSCAHRFCMDRVSSLALANIKDKLEPLEKIQVCLKYDIDKVWVLDAFVKLSTRREPINQEEGKMLDFSSLLVIAAAKQRIMQSLDCDCRDWHNYVSKNMSKTRDIVEKEMMEVFATSYDRTGPRSSSKK